jgi:dienelactone hydrolase
LVAQGCIEHRVIPAAGPRAVVARPVAGGSSHGPSNGAAPGAGETRARQGLLGVGDSLEQASTIAPSALDYRRQPVEPELVPLARFGLKRHRAYLFRLPSAGDNRQAGRLVTGRYYEGRSRAGRRLILVLPIYGSSTYPPRKLARRLLAEDRRGTTDVLLLDGRGELFDWPAMAEARTPEAFWAGFDRSVEAFRTVAVDVRRLLDWAETRPRVDSRRIGLVGFSIGAFVGSVVVGADERVAAAVLVMGGGHLHDVFATCYGDPVEVTQAARVRFGWSEEAVRRELAAHLAHVEPVRYAPAVDPRRVLLVEAGGDDCIPAPGRDALWRALARPEKHTLGSTHRRSFLSMTFIGGNAITRRITEFLGERL